MFFFITVREVNSKIYSILENVWEADRESFVGLDKIEIR